MARKNMTEKQLANLKPFQNNSEKKQREISKKGGKASGEAKRQRKTLKEELLALLSKGDTQEQVSLALIQKAMTGDVRAFEVLRDTIGESPKQIVEVTKTVEDLNPLAEMLADDSDTND